MAEPIKMPFGLRTQVGPGSPRESRSPDGRGNFEGEGAFQCTGTLIQFGLWA